jgi:GTP-binding protein
MFIDSVTITVKAGTGGDGIVAFRREKYVPLGGPAGGSGGRGGHVILVGDEGLTTLLDLRFQKEIRGLIGENGMSKGKHGKDAEDVRVKVPIGSMVFDLEGNLLADITKEGQEALIAKGGRGGRGNIAFATTKYPAPDLAEKGEPGEIVPLSIELKLLADVGLVGLPSVGKSTIISVISAARPKIADYPFTTLRPNLGVVQVRDHSFVVADMPGLIEGASQGAGLGIQFLRHIERTKVLVHVLDASQAESIVHHYDVIREELGRFNPELLLRPEVIVINKSDLILDEERPMIQAQFDQPIHFISAATNAGLQPVLDDVLHTLQNVPKLVIQEGIKEYTFTAPMDSFDIHLGQDNVYEVRGAQVERLLLMTDFGKDLAIKRFAKQLRSLGIDAALRAKGLQSGDTVRILTYEFEYQD